MSTYNDSEYISQTIKSVLRQTFTNWEFIIINDASTDNSHQIISKYANKDKRFRCLINKKNLGYVTNLARGVRLSKGKFVARIDSHDIWVNKDKLRMQYEFLRKNQNYGLIGTWAKAIDEKGEGLYKIKYLHKDRDIRKNILLENCFIHSSVLARRSIVVKLGNYDPLFTGVEDYSLWLKLGTLAKFTNIPKYLVHYRIQRSGISQVMYQKQITLALTLIKKFKYHYPNYHKAKILWHLRKYYPFWFRTFIINKLKEKILNY
jgi:glycosyltransferase involved in cell wall biosynthesis